MSVRGTKPVPTHLQLVRGNPSKNRITPDTVRPSTEIPPAPAHLLGAAEVEWYRIAKLLLECGLLAGIDVSTLAAYAQLYGRWVEAETALNEHKAGPDAIAFGLLVATTNGTLIQNPLVGLANAAARDMVRYCVEFGMTPSSRTRVHAKTSDKKDEDDPIAAYGV